MADIIGLKMHSWYWYLTEEAKKTGRSQMRKVDVFLHRSGICQDYL